MIDIGLILLIAAKLGIASVMIVKHITKVLEALMQKQNELQASAAFKADQHKNQLQAQIAELKADLARLSKAQTIEEVKAVEKKEEKK